MRYLLFGAIVLANLLPAMAVRAARGGPGFGKWRFEPSSLMVL
jgi:hypothetical protein